MKLNINKYLFSFLITGLIITLVPTTTSAEVVSKINTLFVVTQQKTTINYEKSQPSSIDSSTAIYIVIGLLIAATIIPLATWWYFSK